MRDLEQKQEFTAAAPQPRMVPLPDLGRLTAVWAQWKQGVVGTAVGLGVGLYIGWIAAPVEWTDISFPHMEQAAQVTAVDVMSDLNAYAENRAPASLLRMASRWDGVEGVACGMAGSAIENEDYEQAARLIALAYSVAGDACGLDGE